MILFRRRFIHLLILASLAACSPFEPFELSTDVVGVVTGSTGFPSVIRHSRPYILAEQSKTYPADIISTDEQSLVEIELVSGTILSLGTHSQLHLSNIELEPSSHEVFLGLTAGSLAISADHQQTNLTVEAANAVIRTSGAEFWLGYSDSNDLMVILLGEGEIQIENENGHTLLQTPFQATEVAPRAAPQEARHWAKARFDDLLEESRRISR